MPETYMNSILDLVNDAEDSSTAGLTAGGKYLSQALGQALAALESNYESTEPVISSPERQGEEYAQMFASIAESFSTLFSELNAMRSSYLPFELATEIPLATGEEKTFEEIIDIVLEHEGPNDGLVSSQSASWGENITTWQADHAHLRKNHHLTVKKSPSFKYNINNFIIFSQKT